MFLLWLKNTTYRAQNISSLKLDITRVDLAELICGTKLKSMRIAYTFLIFNSIVKPSHFLIKNKQDLYLALDKIKIK